MLKGYNKAKRYPCSKHQEISALGTNYTPGHGNGVPGSNSNAFVNRREMRANNMTGALPALGLTGLERQYGSSAFDFEGLLQSLRELFEQDRQIASQQDATRCGVCYLHYPVNELFYRDEGFYVCSGCERALGKQHMPMLHSQQKL